ncbi:MAG: hypothetical protein JJV98_13755 [Desulfosarcina sp.]|nr:hypothetical protein [Desulfobacterales bacterium]
MNKKYNAICQRIVDENHGVVGVSFRELDCGCVQFCGLSRKGQTPVCSYHLSGQPPTRNLEPLVCLKCRKDEHFAAERTVQKGIVWSANSRIPLPRSERLQIGRLVLGGDYKE